MAIFSRMFPIRNSWNEFYHLISFFQNRYFTLFVTVYRIIIELGDQIRDRVSC